MDRVEKPRSVGDVLDAAADLLTPEGAWTQGAYGRTSNGMMIMDCRQTDVATCFCLIGALEKASGDLVGGRLAGPLHAVISPDNTLVSWNDAPGRTQAEVVAALRTAATLSRQKDETTGDAA